MKLTESELSERLRDLLTTRRYRHSIGVMQTAARLAGRYGANVEKARIAGLVHDCARDLPPDVSRKLVAQWGISLDEIEVAEPKLIHGPLGCEYARRQLGINDPEILNAIRFHATGRVDMSLLEKVIYVADCIEPGRVYRGVANIREAAGRNLDEALIMCQDQKLLFLIKKGAMIHPRAIDARNSTLMHCRVAREALVKGVD
ncbi:MAG TPA: HD domain-containing protein [Firmicutes bacterium]|nr:HD domain-containing protein [Bacillota bacterium]